VWTELDGIKARYSDRFFHMSGLEKKTITITLEKDANKEDIEKALKINSIVDTY
jgi:hypothetical protein